VSLFFGLLILIGDRASVEMFKEVFERLRPCHNPTIKYLVHTVDGCGGKFGFVSSHATNSFSLAVFSSLLLKSKFKWITASMLFWAALVSYSRIYVGVHFPADILGGAILGSGVGVFVFLVLKIVNQKLNLKLDNL
jgi:undecaprenyl-diphosphatase